MRRGPYPCLVSQEPFLGLAAENRKGAGRTADEIDRVETTIGRHLPSDYRALLEWGDGWEGWIGEGYLQLHGLGDLQGANDAHFQDGLPGLVAIGGNGGLETYALDYREGDSMSGVVAIDRNSADESDVVPVAETLAGALVRLRSGEFG
jgi:hypothetical protein